MRTQPVKPFVRVDHQRFTDPAACFAEIARKCAAGEGDFLDGVLLRAGRAGAVVGALRRTSRPFTGDYTFEKDLLTGPLR
jgi:hypothetical protein